MAVAKNKPKNKFNLINVLDVIISSSVFLIVFICPMFFMGAGLQGQSFDKFLLFFFLTIIGVIALVVKWVVKGEAEIRRTPFDIPVVVLLLTSLISSLMSVNMKDSLIGSYGNIGKSFSAFVVFVLFYYLVVNNINKERMKLWFWGLVSSIAMISVYSLTQINEIFILPFDFTQNPSFNPIGSISALVIFLIAGLPILITAVSELKGKGGVERADYFLLPLRVFMGFVVLLSFVSLVLLNSFVSWSIVVFTVVFLLVFYLSRVVSVPTSGIVITALVFIFSIVFLVLGNFNIIKTSFPTEVSLTKGISWDIAKENLKENVFFGSGPATFDYAFNKFKGVEFNNSILWDVRFDSATGVFSEILSDIGILGVASLLVIVLIMAMVVFIAITKSVDEEYRSIVSAYVVGFLSIFLSLLLLPYNNSLILQLVIVSVLMTSSAIIIYPKNFKVLKFSFKSSGEYALVLASFLLIIGAVAIVLLVFGVKLYLADFYMKRAINEKDYYKKIESIQRAVSLAPYQDVYYLNLANWYLGMAKLESLKTEPNQSIIVENLRAAIASGGKAVEITPAKVGNIENLAAIYENASFYISGSLEWAEKLYNDALVLAPDSPYPYFKLAMINTVRFNTAGDDEEDKKIYLEEALSKYDSSIEKKINFASAYYGKAVLYEKNNNIDFAIEEIKKAIASAPDSVDYRFELGRLYFNRGISKESLVQESPAINVNDNENDLSVQGGEGGYYGAKRNDDINISEKLFLEILSVYPDHVNSKYGLALLYQKLEERDNAKRMVKSLLDNLSNENDIEMVKKQFGGLY